MHQYELADHVHTNIPNSYIRPINIYSFRKLPKTLYLWDQEALIQSPDMTGIMKVEAYLKFFPRQLSVTKWVTRGVLTSFKTDPEKEKKKTVFSGSLRFLILDLYREPEIK